MRKYGFIQIFMHTVCRENGFALQKDKRGIHPLLRTSEQSERGYRIPSFSFLTFIAFRSRRTIAFFRRSVLLIGFSKC